MTVYKVLAEDRTAFHGGAGKWTPKRWRTVKGELVACENGIHYCRRGQLIHWLGPAIWTFEDGTPEETVDAGDKMVTRRGRILARVETWNATTARLFAADCAEAVLPLFERERPHDDRPRLAIEAARRFARGEIDAAALDASSATAALDAARAAAWAAARDAARAAAGDAARAAAWAAARDAAWDAAWAAAWAAAGDAARAAARAAAWAATGDATGDAARAAQTEMLLDYLEGRRSVEGERASS